MEKMCLPYGYVGSNFGQRQQQHNLYVNNFNINSLTTIISPSFSSHHHINNRWIIVLFLCLLLIQQQQHYVYTSNNLPLLASTLRTHQVFACDNEELKLECDSRTVVNIVVAQYGQTIPKKNMCRSFSEQKPQQSLPLIQVLSSSKTLLQHEISSGEDDDKNIYEQLKKQDDDNRIATEGYFDNISKRLSKRKLSYNRLTSMNNSFRCFGAKHLRYKFLIKIEETCREQHRCILNVSATNIGFKQDPCSHVTKYAEVAYKCRPFTFINKIICLGKSIHLQCNDRYDRIVIFSATFGASWSGVSECPGSAISKLDSLVISNQFPNETTYDSLCQDRYATETVMRMCHGKRNCTITADYRNNNGTFSVPNCPILVKYYFKVVYTCISKRMVNNELMFVEREPTPMAIDSPTIITTTTISKPTTSHNENIVTTIATSNKLTNLIDDDGFDLKKSKTSTILNKITDDNGDGKFQEKNNVNDSMISVVDGVHPVNNQTINSSTRLLMDSLTFNHLSKNSWKTRLTQGPSSTSSRSILSVGGQQHHINCTELTTQMQVVGFISDWISAIGFVKRNQERLILYLLVSLFGSLICFLIVLSARLYYQKGIAMRKAHQEQTVVPHFDFEDLDDDLDGGNKDDHFDNDDNDDNDDDDDNDDNNNAAAIQMLPTAKTSVGFRDYTVQKRKSVGGFGSGGYSTIRRPHSSSILLPNEQQYTTTVSHQRPIISTLSRNRHYHHHNHQQQPQVRYSTTTRINGYRSSSSVSPTTIATLPKSILRDSGLKTQIPIVSMEISPTTVSTNINDTTVDQGSTLSFLDSGSQKISTIELVPSPQPSLAMLSTTDITRTPVGVTSLPTSQPSSNTIDNIIGQSSIYHVVRCPKFPVNEDSYGTVQQLQTITLPGVLVETTTTNTTTNEHQQQPPSTQSTLAIIETSKDIVDSMKPLDDVCYQTEPKILSSNLGNFLV